MALDTMLKNLCEARAAYDAQLKVLAENGKEAVGKLLGPLIPPGYAVEWKQYTDYFNDGDACSFAVHEPYLVKSVLDDEGEPDDDDDDDDDDDEEMELSDALKRYGAPDEQKSYQRNIYSKPLPLKPGQQPYERNYEQETVTYTVKGFPEVDGYSKDQLQALCDAWDKLPYDLMEQAFGDHTKNRVYAGGEVGTDEYTDHD